MMKNSIKKIYIHVGLNKTGTTSIQNTLYHYHTLLSANDVYYPSTWEQNHNVHIMSLCLDHPEYYPINIKENRTTKYAVEVFNAQSIASLTDELNNCSQSTLLFSGEDISLLPLEGIRRLHDFLKSLAPQATLKIIISYRELSTILASDFQQKVKSGKSIPALFAEHHTIDYRERTEKFMSVFGSENVIGYAFEDAIRHPNGIVGKFTEMIGLPENQLTEIKVKKKNEGISDKAIDLLSYVNEQEPLFNADGSVVNGRFRRDGFLLHQIKGDKFCLTQEMLDFYLKENHAAAVWLKETFGIDYLVVKEHAVRKPTVYDTQYVIDIKRFYPFLTPLVQKHVKAYLLRLNEQVTDETSRVALGDLKRWLTVQYFRIVPFKNPKVYEWGYALIRKIKRI